MGLGPWGRSSGVPWLSDKVSGGSSHENRRRGDAMFRCPRGCGRCRKGKGQRTRRRGRWDLGQGSGVPLLSDGVFGGLSRENRRDVAGTFRCLLARMGHRTRIPGGRSWGIVLSHEGRESEMCNFARGIVEDTRNRSRPRGERRLSESPIARSERRTGSESARVPRPCSALPDPSPRNMDLYHRGGARHGLPTGRGSSAWRTA